eukprot:TRINITY_DN6179_c0_g1_i1.p1 TRINITY_DN6179_c0_g1~~TRINITY_DN6179_c0_g1_i1.p1  ORF type:complete len:105 (-),score=19.77 TRINITY_DN6179_c0_g1_i1:85-399(-)
MKVLFAIVFVCALYVSMGASAKPVGGIECTICDYVVEYVEGYVQQNATQAQIEQAVDNLCLLIPGYQKPCDEFVAEYVPKLINVLIEYESPATACAQVGACTSK